MKTILITRPWKDSIELARMIKTGGHLPVIFPAVEIVPPEVLPDWVDVQEKIKASTLCIFLSGNAVNFIPPEIKKLLQNQKNIFAMGEGTAMALHNEKIACFAIGQEGMTSEKLIETETISSLTSKDNVVIFAGKGGRVILQDHLVAQKIEVYRVETYQRNCPKYTPVEVSLVFGIAVMPDIITVTSQVLLDNTYSICPRITTLPLVVPSKRIKEHAFNNLKWATKIIVAESAKNTAMFAALRELLRK